MQQHFSCNRTQPAIVALVMLFTMGACSFETPQAPKWDATLSIPLINRHYTMQQLIDEESSLYSDSLGQVHYLFATELDSFRVGNQLTFEQFSNFYNTPIGQMPVASPGSENLIVTLSEIYPEAAALDGRTTVVPAFNFDLGKRVLSPYDGFDWLEIASGTMTIHLNNNLMVTLGSPLHFALLDTRADTVVVGYDYSGEVAPGGEFSRVIDLAGKKFSNQLSLEISGSSPGSRNQEVLISAAASFTINVSISDLQVRSARARISSLEVTDRREALIDRGVAVSFARIKQGTVRLQLSSQLPIPATVSITMPDFISSGGDMVTETIILNGTGTVSRVLNFAGYRFEPEAAPLGEQTVLLVWTVQTPGSGANYVTIQSSDEVNVSFSVENMIFSEVTGTFQGKSVAINPTTYSVDVLEGIDSVHFENAQLEMRLRNGINFPVQTDLLLEGVNDTGRRVEMRIQETILAGESNGQPVESQIVLTRNNSNVSDFLNALPSSIRVSGTVTIGGTGFIGTVRESDAVTGTVNIDAPLSFSLPSQSVEIEGDSLAIDEDAREQIRDNLHDGKLAARILNHLPLGASISFYFGRSESTIFSTPALVIGPVSVQPASLDADTGLVLEPLLSEVTLALTEEQLKVFDTAPLFSGLLVDFPGTDGHLVRIIRTDYIDIRAVAQINSTIDTDSNQ